MTPNTNSELWKRIESNPNYIVSNTGRVKNTKTNKEMNPHISNTGYAVISMSTCGKITTTNIHSLVAKAFVENPNKELYTEVHHIDGDKLNNNADNLKWVTRAENLGYERSEYTILRTYLLNSMQLLLHEAKEKGLDLQQTVNEMLMYSKDVVMTNDFKNRVELR